MKCFKECEQSFGELSWGFGFVEAERVSLNRQSRVDRGIRQVANAGKGKQNSQKGVDSKSGQKLRRTSRLNRKRRKDRGRGEKYLGSPRKKTAVRGLSKTVGVMAGLERDPPYSAAREKEEEQEKLGFANVSRVGLNLSCSSSRWSLWAVRLDQDTNGLRSLWPSEQRE